MIWNQWAGAQLVLAGARPPRPSRSTASPYHFYNNGGELMFFRDRRRSPRARLTSWLPEVAGVEGLAKSSDVPWQLEYGVEISATAGTETFPMTGLSFSLSSVLRPHCAVRR